MARAPDPWWIAGPITTPERPALAEALRLVHRAERRPPHDGDRPPPSTFPMTPAARAAFVLGGGRNRGRRHA